MSIALCIDTRPPRYAVDSLTTNDNSLIHFEGTAQMFRIIRFTLVGFSVLALCTACGGGGGGDSAQNGAGENPPPSQGGCSPQPASTQPAGSLGAIVDAEVATEMQAQGMPGMTVAIAKKGEVLYAQGYGYANLSGCLPMQAADHMQMGSISKQFTAAAVLQLRDAGLIDIDRAVVSYLPDYAFDSRITVRMLLDQISGLPEYFDIPSLLNHGYEINGVSQSIILNAIVQTPLRFTPGTAHDYSNSNYYLLGSIIEAVTSQTYADYMAANVLAPAGLSDTSYLQPATSASPYERGQSGPVPGTIFHPSAYFSAGNFWTNVQDLAVWDEALLSGKVIPQASLDLMLTPPDVPYFQSTTPSNYAMGWVVGTVSGHPFIWHNGATTTYTAFNGVLRDSGLSVTVLTNYIVNEDTPMVNFGQKVLNAICNSPSAGGC